MEVIIILIIIIIYFTVSLNRERLSKVMRFKLCAICCAVLLTWVGLLIMKYRNIIETDTTLIALLMGGSVVGFMYVLEKYFKSNKLSGFWFLRIVVISGGFLISYYILKSNWDSLFLTTILTCLVAFLGFIFLKNPNKGNISEKQKELNKKLEHCCD